MTKNYRESTPPETLERINRTAVEIGKLLADEPKYMNDGFDVVARKELIECCDPIWHKDLVRQLDLIDFALDIVDATKREIIRSRI
jgi:hypothetical protein